MKIIATCPDELKFILAEELYRFGADNIKEIYRAVSCEINADKLYDLHLHLRTASQILLVLKEFAAKNQKMLTSQAQRLYWSKILSPSTTYLIEGITGNRGEGYMTSNEISKSVRAGLESSFNKAEKEIPKVDLKDPDLKFVAFVRNNRATLSVDTTSKSMHKRGYRSNSHPAPIKETLAAALLQILEYTGEKPLWDPFCGSGTIAIEASYLALNKASLIHRKKNEFGFEHLVDFDKKKWRESQDAARHKRKEVLGHKIFASDIDQLFIEQSREHALKARTEKYIEIFKADFFKTKPPTDSGLILSNLPYGERLSIDEEKEFFQAIGDHLKQNFTNWRAAFLVSADSAYKFIGLKTTRKYSLKNGSIDCKLLVFDLYPGSKKKSFKIKNLR